MRPESDPRKATAADGRPLFAPRGMMWVPDTYSPGDWNLVDIEAVASPETYVNPRKGDPDYPDPDWSNAVLAPTVEEIKAKSQG